VLHWNIGTLLLEAMQGLCVWLSIALGCSACRCAEAFVSAGHHAKAVTLLVRAGEPARALELLLQHEVPLSEELAEALTPEKTPDNTDSRSAVLMRIAQVGKAVLTAKLIAYRQAAAASPVMAASMAALHEHVLAGCAYRSTHRSTYRSMSL
jgi:hypothetical protein